MTFYFSIRDDDTCYFTRPEQLEANYHAVWGKCPISVSVVPFHACTRSGPLPAEFWQGDDVFPVGDNQDLVEFLREKIAQNHVYLTMHGYSHKDEADGFEFEAGQDLERKVAEGKRYLEQVFGVPIKVFVPPHNALSCEGFKAVVNNGLNLCGSAGARVQPFNWAAVRYALLRRWWRWVLGGEYPFPCRYGTHVELGYQSLTPLVSLSALRKALAFVRKWQGWFCLATHYWEFGAKQQTGEDKTMGEVFQEFWTEVSTLPDVHFTGLGSMESVFNIK